MRLLMVGPWRATAMRRHIDWAVESGIEVCVADFRILEDVGVEERFELIHLTPRQKVLIGKTRIHRLGERSRIPAGLRLHQIVADFQPDLIHSYMLTGYTDVCLRSDFGPLVVSAWGFLNRLMIAKPTVKERTWLRRLRVGAHTLLVENPNLEQILTDLAIFPLQVQCFPIGVDGRLFYPGYKNEAAAWRFVLDIPPEATVLLSPRGWSKDYGQTEIMKAFAQASHRLAQPLVLVFLGLARTKRPEKLAREVLDLGASLGVGHAIRWIPEVPYNDMPGVYNLADIVLNYPSTDAFPSTLLEAAACARPVITSDLPAYRNTFIERCCTRVAPENPAALADAIVHLVSAAPDAWAPGAQQARDIVLAEHGEATQKARLIALYREIAGGTATASRYGEKLT